MWDPTGADASSDSDDPSFTLNELLAIKKVANATTVGCFPWDDRFAQNAQ